MIHFTPDGQIQSDMRRIISELHQSNPKMSIVVPGSGDVGTCPRFEQPLRMVAGWQTIRVNDIIKSTTLAERGTTWIPLAERTSEIFGGDPTLFSQDKFHPNDRGYSIWVAIPPIQQLSIQLVDRKVVVRQEALQHHTGTRTLGKLVRPVRVRKRVED